jgi:hypothetical protein
LKEVSVMAMTRQHVDEPVTEEDVTRRHEVAERRRVVAPRPAGLGFLSLLIILVGAWGGIVPFVGPIFGYRAGRSGSFAWTAPHVFLYLVPGAVAMAFGLVLLGSAIDRVGRVGVAKGLAALIVVACGAWFALGPAVWPIFSSSAVFSPATGALPRFLNYLGYNLGPGLLLTALGAMALVRPMARSYLVSSPAAGPAVPPA